MNKNKNCNSQLTNSYQPFLIVNYKEENQSEGEWNQMYFSFFETILRDFQL
jgi:hypothetical protein